MHTFRYINKILPTETMLQLYHSYMYSLIIYALPIWGSHRNSATYLQPLHRTHKKIIRLICNKPPQTPTKPLSINYKYSTSSTSISTAHPLTCIHSSTHQQNNSIDQPTTTHTSEQQISINTPPDSLLPNHSTYPTPINTLQNTNHPTLSTTTQRNSRTYGTTYHTTSAVSPR